MQGNFPKVKLSWFEFNNRMATCLACLVSVSKIPYFKSKNVFTKHQQCHQSKGSNLYADQEQKNKSEDITF